MAKRIHNPPHPGDVLQDTVLAEGRGEMGLRNGVRLDFPVTNRNKW